MHVTDTVTLEQTAAKPDAVAVPNPIVVLGIGNVLWADEGFGVRCIEALDRDYIFGPEVELVDGGTQGLLLIEYVHKAQALLILDAVDYGLAPGTRHKVEDEAVPAFMGAKKMSLHQTGFQEVLLLSQLMGRYPEKTVLLGCQPEQLDDYGGSLRPVVKQTLEQVVLESVALIRSWGASAVERTQAQKQDYLQENQHRSHALSIEAYELGRPSEQDACRVGDERFLSLQN